MKRVKIIWLINCVVFKFEEFDDIGDVDGDVDYGNESNKSLYYRVFIKMF